MAFKHRRTEVRLADFGWKCRDSKDCWARKMDLDLLRNAELKEAFDEFDKVCVLCRKSPAHNTGGTNEKG